MQRTPERQGMAFVPSSADCPTVALVIGLSSPAASGAWPRAERESPISLASRRGGQVLIGGTVKTYHHPRYTGAFWKPSAAGLEVFGLSAKQRKRGDLERGHGAQFTTGQIRLAFKADRSAK